MNSIIRTPLQIIGYGVYLYYLGLSFRNAAKALYFLYHVKISHVSIWNWIQKYKPNKMSSKKKKKIDEYIIDETAIKIGVELIWFWVVIEPKDKEILLSFDISKDRNMLVAERFLSHIIKEYGEHPVSTDGGTWYPQACKFLKLNHHIHSFVYKDEKSIIERTMQYIKDRTENFDDYFPCRKKKCKLKHVKQWFNLFIDQHNKEIIS
jgi:putative transposase